VFNVAPDGTAYALSGPADRPVVALIHGLGLCEGVFDGMLAALEAEYRVLRYDLYGHGQSAPAKAEASLTVFSDQLSDLMDHLGVARAHVVGFSIGGMINRRFALDHPEKLASLVILNSPHDRGEAAQMAVEDRAKSVREQGAFSTFDAALKRWFTPDCLDSRHAAPGLVREWRGLVDEESYAQAAWVLAHGVRELIAPEPPVSARSLVMTCENDSGSTPTMSHAIAADIAGAEVQVVPDLQHLGLMEQPALFSAPILEFLKKVE
jgi:pimeloyl-ACP methyl ester carboxylesterase